MKKLKCEQLAGAILIVLVLFPMLVKGIMCNDELLLRLWAQKGMGTFFRTTIVEENILKGRVLGAIGNIKFLAFISDNKYIFGAVNALFLLAAIALFGYFTYKVWKNKSFSVLLCVLILVFLPINFEFAVPNAFVIVTLWPMILLEISMIFYLKYLEDEKKKNLIMSAVMFIWSMFLYEFLITYVMLFPIIYIIKNVKKGISLKDIIHYCLPMLMVAIIYLILYVGLSCIFPSNYEGTHLNFSSFTSILHVLKVLFLSAFPTYYSYFNEKYRFLYYYYNNGGTRIENLINPIIIAFVVVLVFLLLYFFQSREKSTNRGKDKRTGILVIAAALIYAVLPALPNALTPMYQEGVTEESFTSIPVSIYLYFAVMFIITYLLWNIVNKLNKRWLTVVVVTVITIGAVGNQIRNQVFVKEQVANYESLVAIEDVLKLNYWKQCGSISISAPNLYETKNSMAVETGHWSAYAAIYGNNLILDDSYNIANIANMVIQDDNSFYFYYDAAELLLTKETKSGEVALKDVQERYKIKNISDCIWDEGGYKVYSLSAVPN